MKKLIIFIILFCLAAPVGATDIWGDLNVYGVLYAKGTNQRLTFDSGSYFDGGTSGHLLFYGLDTDLSFSLDTTDNTVDGPELYSVTDNIIGFREPVRMLGTLAVDGLTTVDDLDVEGTLDVTENLNMAEPDNSTATGFINMGSDRFLNAYEIGGVSDGQNIFLGLGAGAPATMEKRTPANDYDASYNIGIGKDALSNLTNGYSNLCLGNDACLLTDAGYQNVGIGANTLPNVTSGTRNMALGFDAGRYYGGRCKGECSDGVCTGGSETGNPCDSDTDCPGGTCSVQDGGDPCDADGDCTGTCELNSDLGKQCLTDADCDGICPLYPLNVVYNGTFLGARSMANGSVSIFETVIGYGAVGNGGSTITIGSDTSTSTYLKGEINIRDNTSENNCTIIVDADGTCDSGTFLLGLDTDDSIALCVDCSAN